MSQEEVMFNPLPHSDTFAYGNTIYYIRINDTTFQLSVFWSSDTESRTNKLRFIFLYHYP